MPVRIKQRGFDTAAGKDYGQEWNHLLKSIVGLLLAWPYPVNMTVLDRQADRRIIFKHKAAIPQRCAPRLELSGARDPEWIWSLLVQGGFADPGGRDAWIKTSARTPFLTMRGYFSLRPTPTKRNQFIALGVRHLSADAGASVLYDEINHIFSLSSFGNEDDCPDDESMRVRRSRDKRYKKDGPTKRQLRGGGKGVDRWPMFVIHIELSEDKSEIWQSRDVLNQESTLVGITKVLGAMVTGFLSDHHLRPKQRRKRRRPPSTRDSPLATVVPTSKPMPGSSTGRHQPVSVAPNEHVTLATRDDILSRDVQLPRFNVDRSQQVGDAFSLWSRIKSGNPRGIEDGFLFKNDKPLRGQGKGDSGDNSRTQDQPPTAEVECISSTTPISVSSHESSCAHNAEGNLQTTPVENQHEKLQSDAQAEDTISWTNPVTMADILISARTGQIAATPSQRPSSAANTTQSSARVLSSGLQGTTTSGRLTRSASTPAVPKAGSWVDNFLKEWSNPVFIPVAEQSIPQVSFEGPTLEASRTSHKRCSHLYIERAFAEASSATSAKLSKAALKNATIISQVEKKFILVLLDPSSSNNADTEHTSDDQRILTLIDQHAADERIRIESLLQDLCTDPSPATLEVTAAFAHKPAIATSVLPKPLKFIIQPQEHSLFATQAHHFARWGILYDLHPSSHASGSSTESPALLSVKSLPPVIAERCRLEPKILIELLRAEVWKLHENPLAHQSSQTSNDSDRDHSSNIFTRITTCPAGILDLLNSRACRSAIMFNDRLEKKECE
ncbi:MAG: hypothetical protein Q9222_005012, partial [Ikaeria aurantiellina]